MLTPLIRLDGDHAAAHGERNELGAVLRGQGRHGRHALRRGGGGVDDGAPARDALQAGLDGGQVGGVQGNQRVPRHRQHLVEEPVDHLRAVLLARADVQVKGAGAGRQLAFGQRRKERAIARLQRLFHFGRNDVDVLADDVHACSSLGISHAKTPRRQGKASLLPCVKTNLD
jgi:hypothetical protein